MATEANILDSVCLKKGEREENALASEVFEETVTGVETSSDVAEIVNTPLVTDKPTDESGFFYQALSAISDVFSNTPDSFKAAKQTESEDKETTENEEKAAESVEDIVADFEEQELKETPRELGKSVDAQEVTEQREIGSKNIEEQKSEESAEKIEKDESKEIKPDIETEKGEQTGLLQAITSDTAISTHTKSQVEATKHEEEDTDNPLMKEVCEEKEANEHQVVKSREEEAEPTLLKESIEIEEKAIEKAEVEISDSTIEKEQGDPDGVTSSPCVDAEETATGINFKERDPDEKPEETEDKLIDASEVSEECEKEAKEEIDQNPEESVKKINKEDETEEIKPDVEIEEKEEQDELLPAVTKDEVKHSAIATVTKDENEDEEKEQEPEEGLKSTEKDTEIIKSSEETEKHELINSIPSDVRISAQTESVEGTTEKNDEEATEMGQGLSATQRETIIEEAKDRSVDAQEEIEQYNDGAYDEKEHKLDECVNETAHSTKEQEEHIEETKPKVEATEEKDAGILTQINSIEGDGVQKEKSDNPVDDKLCEESDLKRNESKEEGQLSDIVDEDTEETKSSDVITTGVSSSTQIEYIEKAKESKENNDECQKEKLETPLVEEVCEVTSSKIAEPEEGVKHSESSSMTPTVDETLRKEEEFEKKDDIKESEAQGGENDATSSQHASTEDIKETMIGQHDTTVAHVEGVSALPKEIPVEEAEDKSIDAEEMSLKLGQPNPEDEIKKEDKDLPHESVGDINDDSTKEKCTLEQEPVKEHSGQNDIIKEIVSDLSETTEVEPQEDITHSTSFETSTKDASNIEKEKAESENLPTEDLETVSRLQIPELVPKSEDSVLKEECVISEKEIHLDEEIGTVTKEISSDEKTEVQRDGDDVISSQNAPSEDIQESKIGQHDTTVSYVEEGLDVSATPKEVLIEESTDAKEISRESVEATNDDTAKEEKCKLEQQPDEEHTHQDEVSKEKVTDLNETTQVEPQEDITPSISLDTSTEDTNSEKEKAETTQVEPEEDIPLTSLLTSTEDPLNVEKEKAETENLSIEDLETVSEVKISEESVLKEECSNSETKTLLNEEKEIITKETSSDEKPEVQSGGEDVISSQNEPSEDITETTIGQRDTSVAHVEEGQGVRATPKEMLTDQAEDKSIDAEETSLKLGQPNDQNVEETISQNPEDEIKKEDTDLLHNSVEDTNEDPAKEEKCEVEHEPIEEHSGLDDISKEYITELNETTQVEPREDITPSISLKPSTEDTSNSEKEKAETENLPLEDLETVSEVQIPELVPKSEESVLKEDCFIPETETGLDEEKLIVTEEISNDEKTELDKETVTEVCEETNLEKTEFEEGLKLSDTSYTKINEKEITFKDEDEDKDQEIIMSSESQGEDSITSSQIEVSEEKEDLQKENSYNEGNEDGFTKSEGLHEDTEEIKSSVETQENTGHAITTSSSTQIEPNAGSIENEEKNDEKAVVNDENEIVNRDAGLELKQDDIKETDIGEHATTVASIEEGQSLGTITKEILYEAEEEDKSVTGQEHDGENDEELKPEEHTEEIKPSVETNEEKEACISTQNESIEEPTKNEENAIEYDDQKENLDSLFVKEVCEESDSTKTESEERQVSDISDVKTREIVDEDTEETILTDASSSTQAENIEKTTASEVNNDVETIVHDEGQTEKPQSPLVEVACEATSSEEQCVSETPKETVIEEAEDKSVKAEETSLEHEQPNEQNAEETHPCPSETISGNPEEEIKKESKELSLKSVEDIHDDTTKEEKYALKHESVEEHCGLDEVSKEKVTNINETIEVEPKEDITPSASLETSTEDILNSEKEKIETENLPIEDLETVSEVVVPKPEEFVQKEECFVSETETHSDEEKGTITEEISSDEKTEHATEIKQETIKDICEETSSENAELYTSNIKMNEKELTALKDDDQEISRGEIDLEKNPENVCSLTQTDSKEEISESKETNEEPIDNEKEQESITKEITREEVENKSIDAEEASEQSEESVNKPVNSFSDTIEESIKEEADARNNKGIESEQEAENQADKTEDRSEIENEAVLAEKVSKELEQTIEQNAEEIEASLTETISEKTEDKITKNEDLSHDSTEQINRDITKEEKCFPDVITKEIDISALEPEPVKEQNNSQDEVSKEKLTDLKETTTVGPREDTAPSSSLESSIEDTTNSDKAEEAVNEYLPKDLEVCNPEVMPKLEDSKTNEECQVSATDIGTVTKDISRYENLETHGSTQQPENSYSATEENVTQSEVELNNTEGSSEIVKDVILTEEVPLEIEKEKEINDFKEQIVEEDSYSPELEKKSAENQKELISNSDSIPAENPEVTEDISCVSKVTTDVDQEPKKEVVSSLEDTATVESEVDLSNRESTAYPLEGEKLATRDLESDCDVKIPEGVDSEGSKVKEECVDLATAEYADENNVEKQDTKSDEISSAPDNDQETVTEAHTKGDEAKSSDLIIEEKALTKENLEIHGELEPTTEPMIEEQVITKTNPQPEQTEITCENIKNDQTSESKLEEEFTFASGNEIKSIESQNETTKNIILTNEVSEKDNCPTGLASTSTPDQKELANEKIEYSKPIADANTEVAEVKEEIQTEVEDIKAAEDLSCLSKASSNIETSKVEMHENTTVPVLEDSKSSELQSTNRELVPELQTFSADQTKVNERCIESEDQGNFGAEIKDEKSEKEAVKDVIINEVIVEDKSINEEAKLNQLTTETDEVSQIEKSSSRPDELPGTKDSVKDTEELKLIADSLNLKDETLTANKEPNEENETVASEYKLEAKSVIDATAEKANNDDLIEVSQTYPEEQKYEVPAGTESKILTEKIDSSYKQEKPVAEPLTPEAAKMKPDTTSVFIDQTEKSESVVPAKILFQEPAERKSEVAKDQQVDKEETGVKTDEEYEEEEDNEDDDDKMGSSSDAPVMVEASKDIEVKAHKKSHNILSGVGSKVKYSIAKVKKAITGKSSPPKPPSPKVKDQVLG